MNPYFEVTVAFVMGLLAARLILSGGRVVNFPTNVSCVVTGSVWTPDYQLHEGMGDNRIAFTMQNYDGDGNQIGYSEALVAIHPIPQTLGLEVVGGGTLVPWGFVVGLLFGALLHYLKKIPHLSRAFDGRE